MFLLCSKKRYVRFIRSAVVTMSCPDKQLKDCVEQYMHHQHNITQYEIQINYDTDNADHFISEIARILVNYKNEKKLALFGKFARADRMNQNKIAIREFFEHEIFLYDYVFPQFEDLQRKKRIDIFRSYAGFCAASKDTIVLKDMTAVGFKTYSSGPLLDYSHALLLIREIGRFHALSFALRAQDPFAFNKIKEALRDVEFSGSCGEYNEILLHKFFSMCLETLDPVKDEIVLKQYKNFQKVFFKRVQEVAAVQSDPHAVVTHCDLWVSNLLFKYNEFEQPSEICFLDWQLAKVSSPASDISEILFVCLDKKTRDKYYDNFIFEYYTSFSLFLRELGSDPNVMFPFDVLRDHLKKFSVHGLHTAVRMILITSVPPQNVFDFADVNKSEMMFDNDEKSKMFKKRMRDVLLDYITYGYEL